MVVAQEVAGSSPVSRPVVSHDVDGRVRKTPNLERLVRFGVFCCYRAEKSPPTRGCGYRLAPGLDETAHHAFNRAVGAFCVRRARVTDALPRHPRASISPAPPATTPHRRRHARAANEKTPPPTRG